MVFSSLNFIFFFLPAILFSYFIVPKSFRKIRNLVLLFFSLFFYFYGEPKNILVMLLSIMINYIFGILVSYERNGQNRLIVSRLIVAGAVFCNLAILAYFKYMGFFLSNMERVFDFQLSAPDVIMPIGISFFTFQGLSYVLDVHFGTSYPQKNPLNVALYISLFPQLIAGPIVRYQTIASEIEDRNENLIEAAEGLERFIHGLAKKVILANAMGFVADSIFTKPVAELSVFAAWVGVIAYSFQIYYDFSGYSDMAIGLGKIFGFHFLENFNYPYISKSITEFWRRWHMSLGTWFRDYVYIPLGGNQKGFLRQIINIFIVWFLTGFWHGAAWNFIVWGIYFAMILIVEKLFLLDLLKRCPSIISHLYAVILIIFGWVIFRSEDLSYALCYGTKLFDFSSVLYAKEDIYFLIEYRAEFILSFIFSTPVFVVMKARIVDSSLKHVGDYALKLLTFGLFLLTILYLASSTFNPFIYFRF